MKKHIIFICNGNIERSVVASQSLRNILKEKRIGSKFLVDSYGLQGTKGTDLPKHKHLSEYPKEWKATKAILEKLKIDISEHSFQKITPDIAEKASVIIAMDKKTYSQARNALIKQFPKYKNKIYIFSELTKNHKDIKDPFGNTSSRFHIETVKNIYSTIKNEYKNIISFVDKEIK